MGAKTLYISSNKRHRFLAGFTLTGVMIAMAIFLIITIGALNYQYYAALHSRSALAQMTATRAAQLLIDDWKSAGGSATYDPTSLNLGFAGYDEDGFDYSITVDDLPMYMNLSYNDVEHDEEAQITMRKITVRVNWCDDHSVPTGQTDEESSMEFSTYVRVDASGG